VRASFAILFCAVCSAACAHDEKYVGLSFDPQSAPPIPVSIESDRIELVAGIAVKVEVTPKSDGRAYSKDDLLALHAEDSTIFEVFGTEAAREFVFVGLREGESCLQVRINRHEEECIEVRVSASEQAQREP
jgi:hypothetical protein